MTTLHFNDKAGLDTVLDKTSTAIVAGILDWETARKHDGNNISSYNWNRIPQTLKEALKEGVPGIKTDEAIFSDFDLLATYTRNLNTMEIIAGKVAHAHLHRNLTGEDSMIKEAGKELARRVAYIERFQLDVPRVPIEHHLAKMLESGNESYRKLQDMVDVTRASEAGLKPR